MANSNDASVGTDSAGTRYCGRIIAAMEKPLATRTLIAVTSEASRIAFIVVIDSSLRVSSSECSWVDLTTCVRTTPARSANPSLIAERNTCYVFPHQLWSDCKNYPPEGAAFNEITQSLSRFDQRERLSDDRFDRTESK